MPDQDCRVIDFSLASVFRTSTGAEAESEEPVSLEECLRDLFSKITSGWKLLGMHHDHIIVVHDEESVEYLFLNGFVAALGLIHLARCYGRFRCDDAIEPLQRLLGEYYGAGYQMVCGERVERVDWHDLAIISLLIGSGLAKPHDLYLCKSLVQIGRSFFAGLFAGKTATENDGAESSVPSAN